jgi:SOS response regulatory protein OraA/RecX
MGELQVGLHARLMSQALRKLTGNIKRSNTIVIFINQIRMKIGVMFGNPETTTGGNALKFYASVRLDIRRIGAIKNGEEVVGNQTRVKVVKNKVAPPFREAEFEIMYGTGISREGEIIELGAAQGIIDKAGAWYSYNGERIGQGKDNTRTFLQQHPEMARRSKTRSASSCCRPSVLRKRPPKRAVAASGQSADAAAAGAAAVMLLARRDFCSGELLGRRSWRRASSRSRHRAWSRSSLSAAYVDDERYAQQFVAATTPSVARARCAYERELVQRGVEPALIEAALAAGEDWAQRARELRIRRFGLAEPKAWPEKAKQARFLQYRGFSNDHIRSALGPEVVAGLD